MDGGHPDDPGAFRRTAVKLAQQFGIQSERQKPEGQRRECPKPAAVPTPDPTSTNPVLPVIVNSPLDFELKHLDPDHPYLIDRGFSPETIQRFGLGYCGKGLMRGRIAIPLHNSQGRLVGYAGRLVDDEAVDDEHPKYRFPGVREREGARSALPGSEGERSHCRRGIRKCLVAASASIWYCRRFDGQQHLN
jgi:DNA primase